MGVGRGIGGVSLDREAPVSGGLGVVEVVGGTSIHVEPVLPGQFTSQFSLLWLQYEEVAPHVMLSHEQHIGIGAGGGAVGLGVDSDVGDCVGDEVGSDVGGAGGVGVGVGADEGWEVLIILLRASGQAETCDVV
jgi:hypothetical protein